MNQDQVITQSAQFKKDSVDILSLFEKTDTLLQKLKDTPKKTELLTLLDKHLDDNNHDGIKQILKTAENIMQRTMEIGNSQSIGERVYFDENLSPEEREKISKMTEHLEEMIKQHIIKDENFRGKGSSAKVYLNKRSEYCFKIIYNFEQYNLMKNNLEQEKEIMNFLQDFEINGVRIPRPLSSTIKKDMHFLIMENIEGFSLKEIIEDESKFPDDIDWEKFFDNLREFVQEMNRYGVYHQDIKDENVMIYLGKSGDREYGSPVLIDFGQSKKNPPEERGRLSDSDFAAVFELKKRFKAKLKIGS